MKDLLTQRESTEHRRVSWSISILTTSWAGRSGTSVPGLKKIVVVQGELSLRFSEIRNQFMDSMNGNDWGNLNLYMAHFTDMLCPSCSVIEIAPAFDGSPAAAADPVKIQIFFV